MCLVPTTSLLSQTDRPTRSACRAGCVEVKGRDLRVGDVLDTFGPNIIESFAPVSAATEAMVGPARAARWAGAQGRMTGMTVPDNDWVTIREI